MSGAPIAAPQPSPSTISTMVRSPAATSGPSTRCPQLNREPGSPTDRLMIPSSAQDCVGSDEEGRSSLARRQPQGRLSLQPQVHDNAALTSALFRKAESLQDAADRTPQSVKDANAAAHSPLDLILAPHDCAKMQQTQAPTLNRSDAGAVESLDPSGSPPKLVDGVTNDIWPQGLSSPRTGLKGAGKDDSAKRERVESIVAFSASLTRSPQPKRHKSPDAHKKTSAMGPSKQTASGKTAQKHVRFEQPLTWPKSDEQFMLMRAHPATDERWPDLVPIFRDRLYLALHAGGTRLSSLNPKP